MQLTTRPILMGILNVTPDSFSDGGLYSKTDDAVKHGLKLIEEGADIIDVGGESTRPGSVGVDEEEEMRRTLPVIEQLAKRANTTISIDTVKPSVARAAVEAGAKMINDVSMLRTGDELARVASESKADLVLMHSRKTPADMQEDISYSDVVKDVNDELFLAATKAENAGVDGSRIWLDPGIGFAKTASHSVAVLGGLREMVSLGYKVMVGPSRKSFIGKITGAHVSDRMGGTAAAVTAAILAGVSGVRVHDVSVMRQAALVAAEIKRAMALRGEDA